MRYIFYFPNSTIFIRVSHLANSLFVVNNFWLSLTSLTYSRQDYLNLVIWRNISYSGSLIPSTYELKVNEGLYCRGEVRIVKFSLPLNIGTIGFTFFIPNDVFNLLIQNNFIRFSKQKVASRSMKRTLIVTRNCWCVVIYPVLEMKENKEKVVKEGPKGQEVRKV